MSTEQHRQQYKWCARFALTFVLISFVAHAVERYFKWDLGEMGYTFLWLAVLMLAQGCLQHVKSLESAPTDAPKVTRDAAEAKVNS